MEVEATSRSGPQTDGGMGARGGIGLGPPERLVPGVGVETCAGFQLAGLASFASR